MGDPLFWYDDAPRGADTLKPPAPGAFSRLRAFRLVRSVRSGDLLPTGFGVAWARWDRDEAVCLPIPLNLVVGRARLAWLWLKRGGAVTGDTPAEAYERGRQAERAVWVAWTEEDPVE